MSLEEDLKIQDFRIPTNLPANSFKKSPIQVLIKESPEGNCFDFPGLKESGRHLYFLGHHFARSNGAVRFYLLHGREPIVDLKDERQELNSVDLGLEVGFEERLESLKVIGLNYSKLKSDSMMIFYDNGFSTGGHRGSLYLPGSRLKDDVVNVTLLNQTSDPQRPTPRKRILDTAVRYI